MELERKIKLRSKIILVVIIVVLALSALLLLRWTGMGTYSLGIDPDEIYRISWWSFMANLQDVTDRDEIEAIVEHLNAWTLARQTPRREQIGGETPDMQIRLYDEEGNLKWDWSIRPLIFFL